MTDALLIHSPIQWEKHCTPVGDQTSNPPIGLLYIAASLERSGFSVKIYDPAPTGMSLDDVIAGIHAERPRVIGISALTFGARSAVQIAREIKASCDPAIKVGLGGMHVSTDPAFIERFPYFDFAVIGEGELVMVDIMKRIADGREIRGAIKAPIIKDLDCLPFPAHHLINPLDYYCPHEKRGAKPMATMIASRGCPYSCTFCSKPLNRATYRARSGRNVVDEMEAIYDLYGGRYSFVCDTMTLHRQKIIDMCDEIQRRGLRSKWMLNTRVDLVDDSLLEKMAKAGCFNIFFGVESGNSRIRNRVIKKDISDQKIFEAIRCSKKHGIQTNIYMMVGFPSETMKEIDDTINFSPRTGADFMGIHITWPQPGSALYREAVEEGIIEEDIVDRFVNGKTGYEAHNFWPVYLPKGLTLEQLIDAKKRAYRKFYLRASWGLQRVRWYFRDPGKIVSDAKEIKAGINAFIYGNTGSAET